MSTLYGSIEYFEKLIENYQAIHKYEDIYIIGNIIGEEILYDSFVEDEAIRQKYLQNLRIAAKHHVEKQQKMMK